MLAFPKSMTHTEKFKFANVQVRTQAGDGQQIE